MEKFEENNLEKAKAKEDDLKIGYTICLACALYEDVGKKDAGGASRLRSANIFSLKDKD